MNPRGSDSRIQQLAGLQAWVSVGVDGTVRPDGAGDVAEVVLDVGHVVVEVLVPRLVPVLDVDPVALQRTSLDRFRLRLAGRASPCGAADVLPRGRRLMLGVGLGDGLSQPA
jgi:hypothetical protein